MDWKSTYYAPPTGTPCVVSNKRQWTVAKRVWLNTQTLQLKRPFIKNGGEWAWVYMPSSRSKIDFEPTHWAVLEVDPPRA